MTSSVLTLDALTGYYWRLQINTVTNLFVNSICIYLILKHSTAAMKNYKYYMLYNVISTMVMDFHITCFEGLLLLFPYPVSCSTGALRHTKLYYYNSMSYDSIHFTLSATGLSVLIGFLYRYYSLRNNVQFFHTKKAACIIAASVIIYPLPVLIPNFIVWQYSDTYAKEYSARMYPEYFYILNTIACSGYYNDILASFSIAGAMVLVLIVGTSCVILAVVSFRLLQSVKKSLTKATYALHKQFLITLCFQIIIPIACLVIPTCTLFGTMLAGSENMFSWSEILIHIFTLHATLNGLLIIFSIKPYRIALKKFFKIKVKEPVIIAISMTAVNPSNINN